MVRNGDRNVLLLTEKPQLVAELGVFVCEWYGSSFFKMWSNTNEQNEIERTFKERGFPRCVGFLESVIIQPRNGIHINVRNIALDGRGDVDGFDV